MDFPGLIRFLLDQPLLAFALAAVFVSTVGTIVLKAAPRLGKFVQVVGNLGLVVALLLTIAQVARYTSGTDLALPQIGMPAQKVEGGETRVPMSPDGHFWVAATINGVERELLVDTGATITAISPETARLANVQPKPLGQNVLMRTANGTVSANMASIDEIRFGNVIARDLDAVVAPGLGDANVIGMNLLSRLASWRVEGRTLILQPKQPDNSDNYP